MLQLLLSFLFLAHPAVDHIGAERYGRLEKFRGTKIELFARPEGPDLKAEAEKVWSLAFAATGEPGFFEVTLTESWRGKGAVPAVVPPAPITFKLELADTAGCADITGGKGACEDCGSAHLRGAAVGKPELTLDVLSHKTRLCEDLPANDLYATLKDGKTEMKLYEAPHH